MRTFGLYLNNGGDDLILKVNASDIYEAQKLFCEIKRLDLYNLLIIFNIREID
jgi:hypothetical protein